MMELKSIRAVSLPNFKHIGEEGEQGKKKNKKVTECMFTTCTCRLYVHTLPDALGKKKSKMTFQLSYVKRSRAYESLELYTT